MKIGTIAEIWRYPVKSMIGERLESCTVGTDGIPGDRGWALRDDAAKEIRGGKKLPSLMRCTARYLEEPQGGRIPPAEITLPDGAHVRTDAPDVSTRLSALVGRQVSLWPLRPKDDLEHYRRGLPDDPDMERELRSVFGLLPEEPFPDLSVFPQELFQFTSPPGTYFDALPLHLLSTATLAELGRRNPTARFDRRRFRPNFLIATGDERAGFVDFDWCGRTLRIGEATIAIEMAVIRCSMTTQEQGDLPKDPSVLRTIVREAEQKVGVYARPITPGIVRTEDPVELV